MSLKKTAKVEQPHATFVNARIGWEWRVLKTYQTPAKESGNEYARWFLAVRSPMTYGSWEYGDTYLRDVLSHGNASLVHASDEFAAAYPHLITSATKVGALTQGAALQ